MLVVVWLLFNRYDGVLGLLLQVITFTTKMNTCLQYFANSISRLLLPVDGAHTASCEEMATAMSSAEAAAYKGLQQCIETVMAEVSCRLLLHLSIIIWCAIESVEPHFL